MATGGASDIERGTDETFDFVCTPCVGKNKTTEAEKFCCDCQAYYCHKCVTFHDHIPNLQGHKIIDKSEFTSGLSLSFPHIPTERCEQHGRKPVDMYCKQHDSVGCATCMVVEHKLCEDTFYVPEYIQTITDAGNPKDISTQLSAIASSLKTLEDAFTTQKRQIENSKSKSLKQIENFREEINQQLDKLVEKTISELKQLFQSLLDQMEDSFREIKALATEVVSMQDSLQSASANEPQLFVTLKRASKTVSITTEKISTFEREMSEAEISFSANQQLMSLLKEIETLGTNDITYVSQSLPQSHISSSLNLTKPKVRTGPEELNPQISLQTHIVGDNNALGQQTSSLIKIKGKKTYSMQVKSDRKICYIFGACVLEDGTVILADYNNCKLKRLDSTTYTVRDCCDVPSCPYQVCVISQQEVAVACGWPGKLIQFVSVGSQMQITRQITTNHYCYGLAYADDKLIVADGTSMYVYTMTGDRLQQFSKDQSGQFLFSYIYSLAVSRDNSKVYVADGDKGLIILDRNGILLRQFSGPELQGARGVCLCMDESILVCGRDSQNVLQFTAEGELVGGVLNTNEPCISVCWNNSKLFVGYSRNAIDCYDILI